MQARLPATPKLDDMFDALATNWEADTRFMSFVEPMIVHADYQRIIQLGPPALPLILERLRRRPDFWFHALEAISGEDPVTGTDRQSVSACRRAWLKWGRERGYCIEVDEPITTTAAAGALPVDSSRSGAPLLSAPRPLVLVLHGPSGVGKDSIIDRLGIRRLISTTDRVPRRHADGHKDEEADGRDYHFVSPERFTEMIEQAKFAEHAGVYGHRKGLEWRELNEPLAAGEDFIIRTDVQGAESWRQRLEGCITLLVVGVDPALPLISHELDLQLRLQSRNETEAEIRTRLAALPFDLKRMDANDYIVVNGRGGLDRAVEEVQEIIERERYNPARPAPRLRD